MLYRIENQMYRFLCEMFTVELNAFQVINIGMHNFLAFLIYKEGKRNISF